MNTLFIVTKFRELKSVIAPGIAYVATAVKNAGHNTFGLNLNYADDQFSAVSDAITKNNIEAVLIGGTSPDFKDIRTLISIIKSLNEEIVVIVGGYIITTLPELALEGLNCDFGIVGPGEETTVELLGALASGATDFSSIDGLVYLDKEKHAKKNSARKSPAVDFSLIPDLPLLFDRGIKENKSLSIVTSYGCTFKCTFCSRTESGSRYIQRSLDSIFHELDYWFSIYELENISINDDLFVFNRERLLEFCKLFKKYNVKFSLQTVVSVINEDVLASLRDAGCVQISYGIESANNAILKSMNKAGITIEKIEKTLALTRKSGISIVGNFIFGDINETWETANDTLNWWTANVSTYDIFLTPIFPLPGSFIYNYAVNKGIIADQIKHLENGCPAVNVSKMTNSEYRKLQRKIAQLLSIRSRPLDYSVINLNDDNSVDFEVVCTNCNTTFESKNRILRTDSRWNFDFCSSCGTQVKFCPTDLSRPVVYKQILEDVTEKYFEKFAQDNKKIVIWGAKQRTELLLLSSPSLRKCLVKIVDRSYLDFPNKVFGRFDVESPDSLKECIFDYLLVGSIHYKDEIVRTARMLVSNHFEIIDL